MRLFLAISPDQRAREALARVLARVRREALPGARVVPDDNLHITLQFLGTVEPSRLEALSAACAEAATTTAPFDLELASAGAFPGARRARVLWLGARLGAAELSQLARAVTEATARIGFLPEAREFHPHVTLARLSAPRDVSGLVTALGVEPSVCTFRVAELQLMRSHVSHEGARYEVLASFALGSKTAPPA